MPVVTTVRYVDLDQSSIGPGGDPEYSNYALLRNPNLSHSAMEFLILRNPEPAGQPHSLLRFLKIRNYGLPNQPHSLQFLI